jgi:hypothetical protein
MVILCGIVLWISRHEVLNCHTYMVISHLILMYKIKLILVFQDLVLLLLQHSADVNVINGEGQTPRDVAKLEDVTKLLYAAEQTEARLKEERLLAAAREGDLETLKMLASGPCQHGEQQCYRVVGRMHSK